MRKMMAGLMFLLLGALGASAANLVSVSNGTETTEYATITDALAACSGGETLTFLGDVTVSGDLAINKSVAVDLAGHTLRNSNGQFIKPTAAADGLSFRNGSIIAQDCCFALPSGTYTITVSNVVFGGICMLYGQGGRIRYLDDCVSTCDYFISKDSQTSCSLEMWGGVVAPSKSISNGKPGVGTQLTVYGGYLTQDPAGWVASGYTSEEHDETVKGYACHYLVRRLGSADAMVAQVVPVGGGEVREYQAFEQAFDSCQAGDTVRLLKNCEVANTLTLTHDLVIDLNGFSLEKTLTGSFFLLRPGASSFTLKDGTCRAVEVLLETSESGVYDVSFTNCVLETSFAVHGTGATIAFADCTLACDYFVSRESSDVIRISSGCYAVREARNNGFSTSTRFVVTGGRFTFDMTEWLADGYAQICEDALVGDVAYRYAVYPGADVAAYPAAYTLSADGTQSNAYATVAEAVASCPANGTVKFLRGGQMDGALVVPRSMTFDLNGLFFANGNGDFLKPAAGATLNVCGGGTLQSGGSIFWLNNANTTLNVTNCTLKGLCALYGGGSGTANFYADTFMAKMDLIASGNGAATLNVYDGLYAFKNWRDVPKTQRTTGTRIHVYGGRFANNPARAVVYPINKDGWIDANGYATALADGYKAFYESYQVHHEEFAHLVLPDDPARDQQIEASYEYVFYTSVNTAIEVAGGFKGIVQLEKDIDHAIKTANASGTQKESTLDLNGHRIAVPADLLLAYQKKKLTLNNGTLEVTGNDKSAVSLFSGADVVVGATATLAGAPNKTTCGFYVPGGDARAEVYGSVTTTRLVSWAAAGKNTTLTICGDGTNTCDSILWPGTSIPASSTLAICGGWWKVDPSNYVTNNHVKLYHAASTSPCKWRVKSWADICEKGWMFNPVDGVATATGTCDVAPTAPITVTIPGEVPVSKTALVDLKGITFASGALTIDSFVCDPAWPPTAKLTLTDGVLSVQNCLGTTVFIR